MVYLLSAAPSRSVVILVRDVDRASGQAVFNVAPVSAWATFTKSADGVQLSAQEQTDIYDMLNRIGQRPTAAGRIRAQWNSRGEGDEGTRMRGGRDAADDATSDNYRSAMAASVADERDASSSSRGKRGRGDALFGDAAGGGDDAEADRGGGGDFAEDAVHDAISRIDGSGGGGEGGENDDFYSGGGGGGGGEGQGGDEELGGRGFDVLGREGGGEEVAIDYEPEVDDDAGDAGDAYGEDTLMAMGADDVAEGEAHHTGYVIRGVAL